MLAHGLVDDDHAAMRADDRGERRAAGHRAEHGEQRDRPPLPPQPAARPQPRAGVHGCARSPAGTDPVTRVPLPGADSHATVPPIAPMRSQMFSMP